MHDLSYQRLDSVEIAGSGSRVSVQYSEPDQGGTVLLHRFHVPASSAEEPILEYGYTFDENLRSESLSWSKLPRRVYADLTPWLAKHRAEASAAGNVELERVLAGFEVVLASALPNNTLQRTLP